MVDFFRDEEYEPGYSLKDKLIFGSLGIGGVILIVGMFLYGLVGLVQIGGILVLLGLMSMVLPYGIYSFLENRAIRQMENQFPSFLNDLGESKRGGMTLLDALSSARDTDYGRLNSEIEKVHQQMTWGIPFPKVMRRFSSRMDKSPVIQQSISIIIQSFQSGGSITETIEAVSDNASQLREVIQSKRSQLKQQLVIMYIIYFLFVGITIGIYVMLAQLLGLGTQESGALEGIGGVLSGGSGGGGGGGGPVNYCGRQIAAAKPFCSTAQIFGFVPSNVSSSFDGTYATTYSYGKMAYYKSLLFVMLMVQGGCTAAVAGQISEGSPSAGVKHALIMMPLAFVAFMVIVRPMGV